MEKNNLKHSDNYSETAGVASNSLEEGSSKVIVEDWQYTKEGLAFWLNNMPDKSTEHFKAKLDSTPIFAGYAFVVSMVSMYIQWFCFNIENRFLKLLFKYRSNTDLSYMRNISFRNIIYCILI